MPNIDLSILNQRQTPAFYADVFANRPAAGFVGRIFVSTNTFAFYRDNGTGWDLIGGPGTGTITGSGAAGQVSFWNGASTITGENNLWWDSANNHLGINTNTPATALDVNHNGTLVAKFNNTTTASTLLSFENAGNEQWWIGTENTNNDFLFYDATNFPTLSLRTTFKTSGQVLIGGGSTGSGKLVVESAASDNGIQIVGANAPSLRIDSAATGPTKRIGLGISTAVNNFIQGSVDSDMCIFNGSTTASPILFGIYGTTNVQEAARISTARNYIIGGIVDSGQKLQVYGNALISLDATINSINVGLGGGNQSSNVSLGFNSLLANTTGVNNTALGRNTLLINTIGSENVAIGRSALASNISNSNNIAIGYVSLFNSTADNNTAIGYSSLQSNTTGYSNIAIGRGAGYGYLGLSLSPNTTGNENIFIGHGAIGLNSNDNNEIVIGTNVTGKGANSVSIGNSFTTNQNLFGRLNVNSAIDDGVTALNVLGSGKFSNNITLIGSNATNNSENSTLFLSDLNNNLMGKIVGYRGANGNEGNLRFYTNNATPVLSLTIKNSGVLNITSIPTSSAGLVSGDIYSNLGVLTIVP